MLPNFKITLRPNNQVTITRLYTIPKAKRYEKLDKPPKLSARGIDRFVVNRAFQNDLDTFYSHNLKHECAQQPKPVTKITPLPLDLINRFQREKCDCQSEKLGYGKTPKIKYFSHKSGQKIRETGAVIDRLCGESVERCRVVTLTIPSSELAAYKVISDYSGYAVNRLFQVVRRDYSIANWFYVYEHQKRGALHLHICVYHEDTNTSKEIGIKLCEKWREVLQDISAKSGVNMLFSKGFNRETKLSEMQLDNQEMKLGCGAYFSKYASKNSGKYSDDINSINARKYPPSSFWGRSRELAKECEKQSFKFNFDGFDEYAAQNFEDEALGILATKNINLSHSFGFKKETFWVEDNELCSKLICEGYSNVFYVSPKDYQDLLTHFRYLYKDTKSSNIPERSHVSESYNSTVIELDYDVAF